MRKIQVEAKTSHGALEYTFMDMVLPTESLHPYQDKSKFDTLCKSGCINYGKKWSCPPYSPEYAKFTVSYKYINLIMLTINTDQLEYIHQDFLKIKAANVILKSRIDKTLRLVMDKNEYYISTGSCRLCRSCMKKNNEVCCHPDLRTYSLESLGIDVEKVTEDIFQTKLLWYKKKEEIPKYTSIVAGLLTNNPDQSTKIINKLVQIQ